MRSDQLRSVTGPALRQAHAVTLFHDADSGERNSGLPVMLRGAAPSGKATRSS
jgi:hypothetical protein